MNLELLIELCSETKTQITIIDDAEEDKETENND